MTVDHEDEISAEEALRIVRMLPKTERKKGESEKDYRDRCLVNIRGAAYRMRQKYNIGAFQGLNREFVYSRKEVMERKSAVWKRVKPANAK